ncbi:HNH endonuclease [Nocardioides sp. BGMRC 2183]|nr:HNH endonuclease [Nocardioides sp. BGMRC 2183]
MSGSNWQNMTGNDEAITDAIGTGLEALWQGIEPWLPLIVLAGVLYIALTAPLPGRGPRRWTRRDPWRTFKHQNRLLVMTRAGGRCEAPAMFAWGRCSRPATEADHIYPWSKGGATIATNGQALCQPHNRRKSNLTPPWWYVRGLERRRAIYFDAGQSTMVQARMTEADRAARTRPRPAP